MGHRRAPRELITAHESLRQATIASHQRLEATFALLAPSATRADYVHFLRCMGEFHAPLERRLLESADYRRHLGDAAARARTHLIALDLAALGEDPGARRPVDLPRTETLAALFGLAYVFEGSTLGGQVLRRELSGRFGLGDDSLRYVSAYLGATAERWREFLAVLEVACADREARDQAIAAAVETFERLADWASPS